MAVGKITTIVPCLWVNQDFLDMTMTCLSGLLEIDQTIVVNGGTYAQNVNNGLKGATGDIIIIVNNDIEFLQPDWLHHLTWPLEEYDICSIRTSDSDGWEVKDELEEGGKFGSIWAMKRIVYEALGGLDESFGNYFEDLDYHKRAEDAGFKIVKNHAGFVEHKGKATFKVVDPDDTAFKEAREKFRSKWGSIW